MKKRIGTKLYDTDKAIPVLPERGLYKQPNKRTFFLFDGEKITPLEFDQAKEMIEGAGNPDLIKYLEMKPNNRGCVTVCVTVDRYEKLVAYAKKVGKSQKSIIEDFIDSLSIDE